MNLERLKQAEAGFLARYPAGFADPGLAPVVKKHDLGRLTGLSRANLTRGHFSRPEHIAETLLRIISRSSMVSVYEKPRFRDFVRSLNSREKEHLAFALESRLHGRGRARETGFAEFSGMLAHHGIARWSVVSAVPFYFAPTREAFVKPTTAKRIIAGLEAEHLHYSPTPDWEFYVGYRRLLDAVRRAVHPSLSPNYAALSGFLMSTL